MSSPEWPGRYGPPPFSNPDDYADEGRIQLRRSRPDAVPKPRGPRNYRRSDARITEDISERLMLAERIDSSEVTVKVQDGKVMLEGTVPERWMKYTIEDLASDCPGVQDIYNTIRVQPESRAE